MMERSVVIFLMTGPGLCALCQVTHAQDSASFATVTAAVQKARDDDRRQILEAELQAERAGLDKARKALVTGPTQERAAEVHRHLENIKSLGRELETTAAKQVSPLESLRVVAKAQRPIATPPRSLNGTAAFWNPYNRVPDPEVSADLSTTHRRDLP